MDIFGFLSLIGGLALFLYGMNICLPQPLCSVKTAIL